MINSKPTALIEPTQSLQKSSIEKLRNDLELLRNIDSIITQIQRAETDICTSLAQVGELISAMSWDQENLKCIRNKHGFRNRHKDKGNNKNTEGARLNFEVLAHLKDIKDNLNFQATVKKNLEAVQRSLSIIQCKIQFILSDGQNKSGILSAAQAAAASLPEPLSYNKDEGFLKTIAAYHADCRAIKKLIVLSNLLDSTAFQTLNLDILVHRYWVGYFLVQFGETAKEVSEFIKPETFSKAEDNVLRFFFGKLGHYRQKIKNHPEIIYNKDNSALKEILNKLSTVKPDLAKLFNAIKQILEQGSLCEYENISVTLQKEHGDSIKGLTKNVNIKPIGKQEKSKLKEKVKGVKNEIIELEKAQAQFKANLENDASSSESAAAASSASDLEKYLATNQGKGLSHILSNCLDFIENMPVKDFATSAIQVINQLKREAATGNKEAKPKIIQLESLQKSIARLQKIDPKFNSLNLSELSEVISGIKLIENPELVKTSLRDKIRNKDEQIAEKRKELAKLKEELALNLLKKILHEGDNLIEIIGAQDKTRIEWAKKMSVGFIGQYFKDLFHDEATSVNIDDLVLQDYLLKEAVDTAVMVRNKHAMHQIQENNPVDDRISQTIFSDILPWQENFFSLTALLLDKLGQRDKITELAPANFWEGYNDREKNLIISYIIIYSNSRLQRFSKIEEEFSKIKDEVEFFLNPANKLFLTALRICFSYGDSLALRSKLGDAKGVLQKCFSLVKSLENDNPNHNSQQVAEFKQTCTVYLLILSPELHKNLDELSFTKPLHLLQLADAVLEYEDVKKSKKIIDKVSTFISSSSEHESLHERYIYHRVEAKHARVLGIKSLNKIDKDYKDAVTPHQNIDLEQIDTIFTHEKEHLNKAGSILLEHRNFWIRLYGTDYTFQLLINESQKISNLSNHASTYDLLYHISCGTYDMSNNILYDNVSWLNSIAQEKFKEVITLANKALKLAKQCASIDLGVVAEIYLNKGIARLNLEGENSDNAKETFLQALKIYKENPQLYQHSSKEVEVIHRLQQVFKKIHDTKHAQICQDMLASNPYTPDMIPEDFANELMPASSASNIEE
jgi:hypothetical protein